MNNYYYKLAVQNKWSNPFLQQLSKTNSAITNSYAQQRNALNKQYNSSLNEYNNQKETKKAEAIKKGREAYVDYAKSINPFSGNASSLARLGLNDSGFAESENIRTNNAYQTNVGNIVSERDLALQNIDSQIASLENKRRSELAALSRAENQDLYENYYKIRQLREDELQRELAERIARQNASRSSSSGYSYGELANANKSSNKSKSTKKTTKSTTKKTTKSTPVRYKYSLPNMTYGKSNNPLSKSSIKNTYATLLGIMKSGGKKKK